LKHYYLFQYFSFGIRDLRIPRAATVSTETSAKTAPKGIAFAM